MIQCLAQLLSCSKQQLTTVTTSNNLQLPNVMIQSTWNMLSTTHISSHGNIVNRYAAKTDLSGMKKKSCLKVLTEWRNMTLKKERCKTIIADNKGRTTQRSCLTCHECLWQTPHKTKQQQQCLLYLCVYMAQNQLPIKTESCHFAVNCRTFEPPIT